MWDWAFFDGYKGKYANTDIKSKYISDSYKKNRFSNLVLNFKKKCEVKKSQRPEREGRQV